MFRSKVHPLIIPQYEHGRLAGTLASLWGNQDFDRPVIDFTAFVGGVALHDWAYGVLDNLPIGQADERDWLRVIRQGVDNRFDDPVTDIVAKLHLKRLLSGRDLPEGGELIGLIEARIEERLPHTPFSREHFEWADRITRFCDHLAFDFSFGERSEDTLSVCARANSSQETCITYAVVPRGEMYVGPWPFSVSTFSGIVIGYQQAGYPDRLVPEILHFQVRQRALMNFDDEDG